MIGRVEVNPQPHPDGPDQEMAMFAGEAKRLMTASGENDEMLLLPAISELIILRE